MTPADTLTPATPAVSTVADAAAAADVTTVEDTPAARLARRIRWHRQRNRLTQEQLAGLIYCTASAISAWESPNNDKVPESDLARGLDAALGSGQEIQQLAVAARDAAGSVRMRHVMQLPAPPPRLYGRAQDVADLTELLDTPGHMPVTVLTGPPGYGKTALALAWAHQMRRAQPHRFRDAVVYVSLAAHAGRDTPAEPGNVLADILATLTQSRDRPDTAEARRVTLSTLTHDRRVLLVIDDADTSEQVRPLLPSSPGCAVLITSRHRLCGLSVTHQAMHHTLTPLAEVDAAQTLSPGLPNADGGPGDRAVLRRVAAGCDGNPLALRALAEHARTRPDLDWAEIADALEGEHRLRLLHAIAGGDPAASIAARLEASTADGHLSADARHVLAAAGGLAGEEITIEAVAAETGLPTVLADTAMAELEREHLLTRRGRHWHASGLVAEHARATCTPPSAVTARGPVRAVG